MQPVPSPFSHTPPSPSTLHIVLSPVSLSVINYERHKPPGLMLRRGCLPNCTFLESQKAAFIDNAGHTVRLPLYWQAEKHKTGPSQAQKTPALFGAYFYKTTTECFIYVGLLVLLLGEKSMSSPRKYLLIEIIKKAGCKYDLCHCRFFFSCEKLFV